MNNSRLLLLTLALFLLFWQSNAQVNTENKSALTIKQIMQFQHIWIGASPENIFWSDDSKTIYFDWNPDRNELSSLYKVEVQSGKIEKVNLADKKNSTNARNEIYNNDFSKKLYSKNGDLFLLNIPTNDLLQITYTNEYESNPQFSIDEKLIFYTKSGNIYSWNISNGQTIQLTDFRRNTDEKEKARNAQEEWLYDAQLEEFEVLKERKNRRDYEEIIAKGEKIKRPKEIYTNNREVNGLNISPCGKYVTYLLVMNKRGKVANMPDYVSESGFTESIPTRTKVGDEAPEIAFYVYNIQKDTILEIETKNWEGLNEKPSYFKEYPNLFKSEYKGKLKYISSPIWSKNGKNAIIESRSFDNKHRWILLLDVENAKTTLLEHQHDTAWISGPGIEYYVGDLGWLPNNNQIWFQSEESGFSHIYTLNINTKEKKALTSGEFEVYEPKISRKGDFWYFTSNQEHKGVRHFYKMPINGGKPEKITSLEGNCEAVLSPDEKMIAFRFSATNKPWELFVAENKPASKAKQLTHSTTPEFEAYPWRVPEIITFPARDGRKVHARLYTPQKEVKNGAAVVFVHGAGYLQNAHKWWSTYSREYMFHNLLVDNGYTVIDIDYAGSSGYGRNWRTAIYRHMGGNDLTDQTDGAHFLIEKYGIDPKKIGIYGGSYGGFISIFAMLKENETFTSAAAIRSVTDWAHYNHGYTSNILNTPILDPIAYKRSSPIYFADGLKNNLLILHGMLDENVHFQDVVMLQQRFIELGKENYEFVPYPMEDHGFIEPTSWTHEYQKIYKFFQQTLNK